MEDTSLKIYEVSVLLYENTDTHEHAINHNLTVVSRSKEAVRRQVFEFASAGLHCVYRFLSVEEM